MVVLLTGHAYGQGKAAKIAQGRNRAATQFYPLPWHLPAALGANDMHAFGETPAY